MTKFHSLESMHKRNQTSKCLQKVVCWPVGSTWKVIISRNIPSSRIQSQLQQHSPGPAEHCQHTPDLHWQNQSSHRGLLGTAPCQIPSQPHRAVTMAAEQHKALAGKGNDSVGAAKAIAMRLPEPQSLGGNRTSWAPLSRPLHDKLQHLLSHRICKV